MKMWQPPHVCAALQEPLLGQPQIEDFTQVPDQLTLPTEDVSMSVAPDGPSATSSSSVMVGTPDVFSERGSSKPLVTVPLGERDADCNCLPSFPWGPSGRTLDQKGGSGCEDFFCIHFKCVIRSKLCRVGKPVVICMEVTIVASY